MNHYFVRSVIDNTGLVLLKLLNFPRFAIVENVEVDIDQS